MDSSEGELKFVSCFRALNYFVKGKEYEKALEVLDLVNGFDAAQIDQVLKEKKRERGERKRKKEEREREIGLGRKEKRKRGGERKERY